MSDCHTHPTFKLRKNCLVKKYDFEHPTCKGKSLNTTNAFALTGRMFKIPFQNETVFYAVFSVLIRLTT